MQLLRSLFFYVCLFLSTFLLGIAAVVVAYITRNQGLAHKVGRLWGNVNLWGAGVTVKLSGLNNIDVSASYVYAANHQSWFDIFAILGKLPVQFRWLAKQELFRIPILGHAMGSIGYIPINRKDRRQAFESISEAAGRVRDGISVVIFPEGTRSTDGVMQAFKKGGFILAIQSQQPIVPISISGSYRILPKQGDWNIRPGVIRMTIGRPIPTAGLSTKQRDQLIAAVREAIRANLTKGEGGLLPTNEF
ncbi:lysophospholipid acyltransferase family protein [Desulfoferrobacter suflitae]|uniref:lysophospholipid acyltransferase family protein n=1 Tax=Desulfoferrobacter suflitae TaxID=2865782 RepID=UPI0021646CA5|nr:lysophospholipid acyltransferase family protein [Desulfoferrobacter suflitae]MCK8602645.1 1-acyl-sn-glycerol-3-phosphate acyltransferase [Desulfoferrobacter suflitae]